MSEDVFIEKLRDLVLGYVFTNKNVGRTIFGETIQVDIDHAVDYEIDVVKYNNG